MLRKLHRDLYASRCTSELLTCSGNLNQISSVGVSWMWHMYMQILWKSSLSKCIWHQICTKSLPEMANVKKIITVENAFDTKYVQNHYFEGKCSENCHFKMHLTPNMYKIATLKADAQRNCITVKCIWHQIHKKLITLKANAQGNHHLKMQLTPNMYKIVTLHGKFQGNRSLENACDTKYVYANRYFEGKYSWKFITDKMCLTSNMYKNITLKANAKNIITWKCHSWHHMMIQNCYFESKCSGNHHFKMHLTPNMYKIVTLKANAQKISYCKDVFDSQMTVQSWSLWSANATPTSFTLKCIWHQICTKSCTLRANAKEIVTLKCIWHQIYTKLLLWRQMLRKSSL